MKKRVSYTERIQFETLLNANHTIKECSAILQRSDKTLYREYKKGLYMHRNTDYTESLRYSAELSQRRYREKCENCGRPLKIGNDYKLVRYLAEQIKDKKYSPAVALKMIERENRKFSVTICQRTLYNYIYSGAVFLNVTRADLPEKPKAKQGLREKIVKKVSLGTSIEKRPDEVRTRETFGHWEMDSVVSEQGVTDSAQVFTERKTRFELVFKVKTHGSNEPVRILNQIERKLGSRAFKAIFRSITVDNGTENQDYEGLQTSYRGYKKKRTQVYYCHPYSPHERGSNENQNKLIRRFIPKGSDIGKYSKEYILSIEKWINKYPRKLLGWDTAEERFHKELINALGEIPEYFAMHA